MFDHITLRVADPAAARRAFTTVLDELEIAQTTSTPSFSVWGNFALTQTDEEHPIARRVHIAFIAPTPAHVERFGHAGIDAGFADDGPARPRPDRADDYYAALLKDGAGNSFEAVHRDGERSSGNVDHVAICVSDVEASIAFYSTIGTAAGLTIRRQATDRATFDRRRIRRLLLRYRRRADAEHPHRVLRRRRLGVRLFGLTGATQAVGFVTQFEAWLQENGLWQSLTDLGFSDADCAAVARYAVVTYGDGEQLDALGPLPAAQIVAIFRDTPSGSAPTPVPIQLHHIPERRSTDEYDDQYDEREQGDRPPGVRRAVQPARLRGRRTLLG
jgi:catechol 2,3-dioxygenase-like lactoylglutathione lyase family enzyme